MLITNNEEIWNNEKKIWKNEEEIWKNEFEKIHALYQIEEELNKTYRREDLVEDEFLFKLTYENCCLLNEYAHKIMKRLNLNMKYSNQMVQYELNYIIRSSTVMIALMKKQKPEFIKKYLEERMAHNNEQREY